MTSHHTRLYHYALLQRLAHILIQLYFITRSRTKSNYSIKQDIFFDYQYPPLRNHGKLWLFDPREKCRRALPNKHTKLCSRSTEVDTCDDHSPLQWLLPNQCHRSMDESFWFLSPRTIKTTANFLLNPYSNRLKAPHRLLGLHTLVLLIFCSLLCYLVRTVVERVPGECHREHFWILRFRVLHGIGCCRFSV